MLLALGIKMPLILKTPILTHWNWIAVLLCAHCESAMPTRQQVVTDTYVGLFADWEAFLHAGSVVPSVC